MLKWFASPSNQVGVFISSALDEQVRSQHPAAESCLHLSDPLAEASSQLSADVRIYVGMYVCTVVSCVLRRRPLWASCCASCETWTAGRSFPPCKRLFFLRYVCIYVCMCWLLLWWSAVVCNCHCHCNPLPAPGSDLTWPDLGKSLGQGGSVDMSIACNCVCLSVCLFCLCLVGEEGEGGLRCRGGVLHGAAEERDGPRRAQEGQVDGHDTCTHTPTWILLRWPTLP